VKIIPRYGEVAADNGVWKNDETRLFWWRTYVICFYVCRWV
jgi:hypothetical protein